jgi:hypothetical protein
MDELWGGPDPLDPPPYLRHWSFVSLGQKLHVCEHEYGLQIRVDRRVLIVSTNARKTVSGRVIHKIFRADFCGFLLNGS